MKKSTLENMYRYLTGDNTIDLDTLRAEVEAEYQRTTAKATANAALYEAARDVALNALTDQPVTVAELFAATEADLPEGFTKSKLQYAITHYWQDAVIKHENGKSAYTYTRK